MSNSERDATRDEIWPKLAVKDWQETYATLHMWTQIVGHIRMKQTPLVNHWWNTALYLTARGLTTSPIPYGTRTFEIDFDFIDHQLPICTSDGETRSIALRPRSVADFYRELMSTLEGLGIYIAIDTRPNELEDATPFGEDEVHASYDAAAAQR